MRDMTRPEIGSLVDAGGIKTNYLEAGDGPPVVFIHGSGPGVTAYANWRQTIPEVARHFHVYAPDMAGFGFTDPPEGVQYGMETWSGQIVAFLDALELDRVLMDFFTYDKELVGGGLAEVRYRASIEEGVQEAFSAMFPAPRQRWVASMATPEDRIRGIGHETLIIHGREDAVIPVENSTRLLDLIPHAELHVFGRCGHWSQIEWADEFNALLVRFLSRPAR